MFSVGFDRLNRRWRNRSSPFVHRIFLERLPNGPPPFVGVGYGGFVPEGKAWAEMGLFVESVRIVATTSIVISVVIGVMAVALDMFDARRGSNARRSTGASAR